jgi:hypothetical protein
MDSIKLKFRMANIWSIELARIKAHYTEKRKEYKDAGGSPESTTSDNGGGLKIYSELFEGPHKQFGSIRPDLKDLEQPNDRPYSKLEHEEDSEDPATAPSPNVSFKTEGEEPRRTSSTSTSRPSTGFIAINDQTPVQPSPMSVAHSASNGNGQPYITQCPPQPQPSQPYPSQPSTYGNSSYGYVANTPTYPQSTVRYDHHPPYAQNTGPGQGPGNSSYDPVHSQQVLINLEREGNRSIGNTDLPFFESDWNGQQSFPAPDYPYDQLQPQAQYIPDPQQNPYLYQTQWPHTG